MTMSKISNLNHWLAILANVGVVLGIYFLIVEIQQNDQMLAEEQQLREASAFATIVEMFNEERSQLAGNPQLAELYERAIQGSGKFTTSELIQLSNAVTQTPQIVHAAYRYWKAGHIPDMAWQEIEEGVESRKSRNDLLSRLYMRGMRTMPLDLREHFAISEYPEEFFDISEFEQSQ